MDTTIDQQVAMNEALVPHARRLRIGRSNFRLLSNISSKESTLQLVYDVMPIINKCLTGKSSGYDSLRLSQALILWGLYHKRNVDFAYLMWEDFVYQVEHKDTKKSNEMYYPRFTKELHHLSLKLVSKRLEVVPTPQSLFQLPRLSTSAKGKQPATTSKAKSPSALSEMKELVLYQGFLMYPLMSLRKKSLGIPLMKKVMMMMMRKEMMVKKEMMMMMIIMIHKMMMIKRMKGMMRMIKRREDKGNDEDDEEEGSDDEQASDEEEFIHPSLSTHAKEETRDKESFDPIPKTLENTDDEGNGEENLRTNVGREEGHDEEEEEDKLYRDVNINLGWGIQMGNVHQTQEFEDSH
nr:hypothetical protein [Tanacetum cinerariifolium]